LDVQAAIIFTTLHIQDFADVVGDKAMGRLTFPIIHPEAARRSAAIAIVGWSLVSVQIWSIGPYCSIGFITLGVVIASRILNDRNAQANKIPYRIYNVRLSFLDQTLVDCSYARVSGLAHSKHHDARSRAMGLVEFLMSIDDLRTFPNMSDYNTWVYAVKRQLCYFLVKPLMYPALTVQIQCIWRGVYLSQCGAGSCD
jgi:hypothetical protein